jgi:hypothetical protein
MRFDTPTLLLLLVIVATTALPPVALLGVGLETTDESEVCEAAREITDECEPGPDNGEFVVEVVSSGDDASDIEDGASPECSG